jgi:chemotaxis protein MotB
MAGHGGGAWKVAYADFTTAMMAFFMVMWITSQSPDVREAVAEHFSNPLGQFDEGGSLRPKRRDFGNIETSPKAHGDAATDNDANYRKPFRLRGAYGQQTGIGTMVLFADDSAELDDVAKQELRRFVPLVAGDPHKIEVRGHAARRRPSAALPPDDPWQLSYTRCLRTMEFLEELGIPAQRIRLSQAGLHEPQKRELNSRVEVFLLSEIVEDPRGRPEDDPTSSSEPQTASREH